MKTQDFPNGSIAHSDISVKPMTPLEKMCQSFPAAHLKSNGYWTHEDDPRFDFQERPDGSIKITPWTGRDYKEVLAKGQPPLLPRDLYPNTGGKPGTYYQKQTPLTLLDLEQYLKLDRQFLFDLGYEDYKYRDQAQGRTREGVKVGGYYAPDGTPHTRNKVRLSIDPDAKPRFLWDINQPGEPIPCGLHTLNMAREQGLLAIGEGESDYATMLFHQLPFVGIGGADACKQLDVSLVLDIPRIYILEEPDQDRKNVLTGQGFYKNMRLHLREGGYQGEIFSIKFKRATQCKDPSDLHKTLYAHIDMTNGIVYRADLHEQFCAAITSAMETALPEGQECEDRGIAMWIPPMPTDEQSRLHWFAELAAVPARIMSASIKWTLAAIVLHTTVWESSEWYKVDSDYLAAKAGQSKEIFQANLSYLEKHLPIFQKKHEQRWHIDGNGKKKPSTDLYIQPVETTWLAYPSTYQLKEGVQERKQGGVQIPKPKCPVCQSEDVDLVETTMCHNCHTNSHEQTYTSPMPPESMRTIVQVEPVENGIGNLPLSTEEPEPVESTATVIPLEDKNGIGNLPHLYKDIYKDGQLAPVISESIPVENGMGNLPIPFSEDTDKKELVQLERRSRKNTDNASFAPSLDTATTEEEICEQHGLQRGDNCSKCGNPIRRKLGASWECVRCSPSRTYHLYSDRIDAMYPRRHPRLEIGKASA